MNNFLALTTRRKDAASYILSTFISRSDSRRRVCCNLTFSVLRMINYKSWKLNGFKTVFQVFHYSGVSYTNELVSMCKLKVVWKILYFRESRVWILSQLTFRISIKRRNFMEFFGVALKVEHSARRLISYRREFSQFFSIALRGFFSGYSGFLPSLKLHVFIKFPYCLNKVDKVKERYVRSGKRL